MDRPWRTQKIGPGMPPPPVGVPYAPPVQGIAPLPAPPQPTQVAGMIPPPPPPRPTYQAPSWVPKPLAPYLGPGGGRFARVPRPFVVAARAIPAALQQGSYLLERGVGMIAMDVSRTPFTGMTTRQRLEASRIAYSWLRDPKKMESVATRIKAGEDVQTVLENEEVWWRELIFQFALDPTWLIGTGIGKGRRLAKAKELTEAVAPRLAGAETMLRAPGRLETTLHGLLTPWRQTPQSKVAEHIDDLTYIASQKLASARNAPEAVGVLNNMIRGVWGRPGGMVSRGEWKLTDTLRRAGIQSADDIPEVAKLLKEGLAQPALPGMGAPTRGISLPQVKQGILSRLISVADEVGRDVFQVPPPSPMETIFRKAKTIMSVALLGWNPGYVIRNVSNNLVMGVIYGNNPFDNLGDVSTLWRKMGATDEVVEAIFRGYGPVGKEAPKGIISPMTTLSAKMEGRQRAQIATGAMKNFLKANKPRLVPELSDEFMEGLTTLFGPKGAQQFRKQVQTAFTQSWTGAQLREILERLAGGKPTLAHYMDGPGDIGGVAPEALEAIEDGVRKGDLADALRAEMTKASEHLAKVREGEIAEVRPDVSRLIDDLARRILGEDEALATSERIDAMRELVALKAAEVDLEMRRLGDLPGHAAEWRNIRSRVTPLHRTTWQEPQKRMYSWVVEVPPGPERNFRWREYYREIPARVNRARTIEMGWYDDFLRKLRGAELPPVRPIAPPVPPGAPGAMVRAPGVPPTAAEVSRPFTAIRGTLTPAAIQKRITELEGLQARGQLEGLPVEELRSLRKFLADIEAGRISPPQTIRAPAIPAIPTKLKGIVGQATEAIGTDPARRYKFQHRLMELDDIIPSHTTNLQPNPNYVTELQPRMRGRAASRIQIDRMVQALDPDALITDTRALDRGSIIIGADAMVESGNARAIALRRAAEELPENYGAYVDTLAERAGEFGFTAEDVGKLDKPVLVRERVSDVANRLQFVIEANAPTAAAMSIVETAAADAAKISVDSLARLFAPPDLPPSAIVNHPRNRSFVRNFIAQLPETERAALVTGKAQLSQGGVQRITAALFAKAYGDDAGVRAAEMFLESIDEGLRNVGNGMLTAAPKMAQAEGMAKAGERFPQLAIGDDVANAATVIARLRQQRFKVTEYLAQQAIWERELTPVGETMLQFFDRNVRSSRNIARGLTNYADSVIRSPHPSQIGLGVGAPMELNPQTLLKRAISQLGGPPQLPGFGPGAAARAELPSVAQAAAHQAGEIARIGDKVRGTTPRVFELTPELQQMFDMFSTQAVTALEDANLGAQMVGLSTANQALLDYGQRLNFDWWAQYIFPYEFWYSHTFVNTLWRTMDKPALATAYYRMAKAIKQTTDSPEFPERLKGRVRIPLPFLPDWMGEDLFFDPLRSFTPVPSFTEPFIPEGQEGESPLAKAYRYGASIVSPAPWVTAPLALAGVLPRERLTEMAQIPPLRYARGLTGLMGIGRPGGVGIQEPWEIYRAERMLTNMVNTREITPQQAQDAMMSHRGPVWENAVRRAAQERGVTITGQMLGVSGAAIYPQGERISYQLREELNQELEKVAPGFTRIPYEQKATWREQNPEADKAISQTYKAFYKEHPEYGVRSFLFDDPRERVISQLWDGYNALTRAGKKQARADLGKKFDTYIVNKGTRDYTRFTTAELADFAERLGRQAGIGRVAETEEELARRPLIEPEPSPYGEPPVPVGQVPADVARDYDTFINYRNKNFPNIFPIQNRYFALPQGSQQRRDFLAKNPRLKEYWEWSRQFKRDHPRFAEWYARITGGTVPGAEGQRFAPEGQRPYVPWPTQAVSGYVGGRPRRKRKGKRRRRARARPRSWGQFMATVKDADLRALIGQLFAQPAAQRMVYARRFPQLLAWVKKQGKGRLAQLSQMYAAWARQRAYQTRQAIPTPPRIGKPPPMRWYRQW